MPTKANSSVIQERIDKPKTRSKSRYQRVVEAAEALTPRERERLAESLQKTSRAARRAHVLENIRVADEEYANGEGIEGTADELMIELNS